MIDLLQDYSKWVCLFINPYSLSFPSDFCGTKPVSSASTKLIAGIIQHRPVNLKLLATSQNPKAKTMNKYRRLQHFFERFKLPLYDVGQLILSKLVMPKDGWEEGKAGKGRRGLIVHTRKTNTP